MAKRDLDTTLAERPPAEPPALADGARPKLVVPFGRGRVGKSTWTRWATERAISAGRPVVIADGDRTNATLAAFFDGCLRPESDDDWTIKRWLIALTEAVAENGCSTVLDMGAGDMLFQSVAQEYGVAELMESVGVEPVAVHVLGPSLDDLSLLAALESQAIFCPQRTLLVLNEGSIQDGRPFERAYEAVRGHPVYRAALERGAREVVMRRLSCMAQLDEQRLLFGQAADRTLKNLGLLSKQSVVIWQRNMEAAHETVRAWLP